MTDNTAVDRVLGELKKIAVAGDHLNAQRFLVERGDRLQYSPELGRWFVWNGAWWEEDRLDLVHKLANETIDGLRSWVGEAPDEKELGRRAGHYRASTRSGRRDGMLAIARPEVAVAVKQLDRHPHLLACRNGTVDLRSGELLPADREHLITRGVELDYDPGAKADAWEEFLRTIFASDDDLITYNQRLFGYAITGEVGEHILPDLYGLGANGKSALLRAIQGVVGEHSITAPDGLLVEQKHEQHPEKLAVLRGRRLVVSFELERRAILAEGLVKMLTGGDRISARPMYRDRFDFDPTHKIVLVTNHLPRVPGTDEAIWRRLKVVPFDVTIPPEKRIPDYGKLLADLHGQAILAWLVQGAVEFYRNGVGTCAAVERATGHYREREDVIAQFLAERTIEIQGRTPIKDLLAVWREWAQANGVSMGRNQDFTLSLESHGVEVAVTGRASFARGIGLVTESGPEQDECTTEHHSSDNFPYTRPHEELTGREVLRGADPQVIAGFDDLEGENDA
jgi:putative DNA primase/helicase